MTIQEALTYLHDVSWRGSRPGLSRTRELLRRLGDPQKRLRFVHVAGTNGKGSTSAMLAAIFRAASARTGLYTSPFLMRFNERMQCDSVPISDGALAALTERTRAEAESMAEHPTEFELIHGTCHALVRAGALRHRRARGRPRRRAGFHQCHRLPGACRDLQPGLRSHGDFGQHARADCRGEGRDPEGRRLRALRRSAAGGGGRHPGALRRDQDASAHAGFRAAAHRAARADRSGLRLRRAKGAGAAASGAASAKKTPPSC